MATRVSNEQIDELLDFLSKNTGLARGVGLGIRSKETVEKMWNDLALRLNSYGSGSTKSGERWKKYWADLKHKSKSRLTKRKTEHIGTGGGPSSHGHISELDEKILSIIGETAVYGDTQHKIPFLNTDLVDKDLDDKDLPDVAFDNHINHEMSSSAHMGQPFEFASQSIMDAPSCSTHEPNEYVEIELCPDPLIADIESTVSEPSPAGQLKTPAKRPRSPVDRPRSVRPHPPKATKQTPSNSSQAVSSQPKSRISPAWVVEIEKKRVEAETKLADAAMIMAEAARQQADAAKAQIEMNRTLIEIIRQQSSDIKSILIMMRSQPLNNAHTVQSAADHDYN